MVNNMLKTVNAITGGRTGDFFHQLYIPAILYEMHGIKTNLFIAEIGDTFHFGLESAFNELYDIVKNQKFFDNLVARNRLKSNIRQFLSLQKNF